ncbi:MAG: TrmH family RNA methyltransferase [Calditrichaeota bacterium]|nr:MAG: TrmH family RNA methyltransferase [Calditrichota bacterium]
MRKLTWDEIYAQRAASPNRQQERLPIVTLVENVRSMHNVGSIFRSSDGARLRHLYLTGFTPAPPRPEIEKTALGATESVPWSFRRDAVETARQLKREGYQLLVVEQTTDSVPYFKADVRFPLCLIMGNEVDGVSDPLVQLADQAIDIPMLGMKHSLNVSVAYGIVLYGMVAKYL